jgi:kinesin family protein 2/24
MDNKIQVIIRKRPLNSKELQTNQEDVVNVLSEDTVHILERKQKVDLTKFTERHEFVFD